MSKFIFLVVLFLQCGRAFAGISETSLLICRTQDDAVVALNLYQEDDNVFVIQMDPMTSSPRSASLRYWTSGSISKEVYTQLLQVAARSLSLQKNVPLFITAVASSERVVNYTLELNEKGQVGVGVSDPFRSISLSDCRLSEK